MAIATINPANGQTIKTFNPLSDSEIEKKVALASKTFYEYRQVSFAERTKMMRKAAEILENEK